ncbi:MAG: FAD-dependent oxidoreductase [Gemmatimonadaceae bacterium]
MTSSGGLDVIVVGGGIVALATARSLAARGARVFVSSPEHPGTSSSLGAGVLAPTIEAAAGSVFSFACASREYYREFAASIHEETGIDVQLDLAGVLRLALTEREGDVLRREVSEEALWISPAEVRDLEPNLAPSYGALLHHQDGIVANDRVHAALRTSVRGTPQITWTSRAVSRVKADDEQASVWLSDGTTLTAPTVVVAAGAWSASIAGLPVPPPVVPLRGQMLAVAALGLRRAVYGAGGYLTPRQDGRILSGSTMEHADFDATTTPSELDRLEGVAATLLPSLAPMVRVDAWAGLRPMSPDGFPVIDRDPLAHSIVYATGHTRNGLLMGPLTGEVVCDLVAHEEPSVDITPFSGARFAANLET